MLFEYYQPHSVDNLHANRIVRRHPVCQVDDGAMEVECLVPFLPTPANLEYNDLHPLLRRHSQIHHSPRIHHPVNPLSLVTDPHHEFHVPLHIAHMPLSNQYHRHLHPSVIHPHHDRDDVIEA